MERLPWPEYFMRITYMVAERSTCSRRKVGAIAVKNNHILATGYNGAPAGLDHCLDIGCLRQELSIPSGERHEICRAIHAEQNLIIQSAVHGANLHGADIYCTTFPCGICAKMLINCGIKQIFFVDFYPDTLSTDMLTAANIPYTQMKRPAEILAAGELPTEVLTKGASA